MCVPDQDQIAEATNRSLMENKRLFFVHKSN